MDIQEIIYEEGTQEKEFREKGSRGKKNKKTENQQKVTYDGIRKDPEIHLLIEKGNEMLGILAIRSIPSSMRLRWRKLPEIS